MDPRLSMPETELEQNRYPSNISSLVWSLKFAIFPKTAKKIVVSKNECNKPQLVQILICKVFLFQKPFLSRQSWLIKVGQLQSGKP